MKYYNYITMVILLGFVLALSAIALGAEVNRSPLYRAAIIDTGYNQIHEFPIDVRMCDRGHYDYRTRTKTIALDFYGHGTAMSAVVAKAAGNANYCIMMINVHTLLGIDTNIISKAIYRAVNSGAHTINLSLEGPYYSRLEKNAIRYARKKKVMVFAAAGNKGRNLNLACYAYPACYKGLNNLRPVGALNKFFHRATYSNYGRDLMWYPGYIFGTSGTSTATAYATGSYLKFLSGRHK